jgi:hypothetical protein
LPAGWEWVERLTVRHVHDRNVRSVMANAPLEVVSSLDLSHSSLRESDGMSHLAGCARLGLVRELFLDGLQPGGNGLRALLASPHLTALRGLSFRDNDNVNLAGPLADWPGLAGLERLDLSGNRRHVPSAIGRLTASAGLSGLRRLILDRCALDEVDLQSLAKCQYLGALRDLSLNGANLLPYSPLLPLPNVSPLLKAPWFANVRRLSLCDQALTADNVAFFRDERLSGLEVLDLSGASVADVAAIRPLVESPHLAGLRKLHFDGLHSCSPEVRAPLEARFAGRLCRCRCEL